MKITQITSSSIHPQFGYGDSNMYCVFGLGDDNQVYEWNHKNAKWQVYQV
jgi:hypothetical protein